MELQRLKELRNFFANVPEEKVQMKSWGEGYNPYGNNEEYSCLTAGCLAGWAGVYAPFRKFGFRFSGGALRYKGEIDFTAFSDFFDISMQDTIYLCNPSSYENPDDISKAQVLAHLDEVITRGS